MGAREIKSGTKVLEYRVTMLTDGDKYEDWFRRRNVAIDAAKQKINEMGSGDYYVLADGTDVILCCENDVTAMLFRLAYNKGSK
jgi:hypothetical protein